MFFFLLPLQVSGTDAWNPCQAHVGCLWVAAIVIHKSVSDRLRNGLPLLKALSERYIDMQAPCSSAVDITCILSIAFIYHTL